jgi:hypothetical protein
MITFFIVSINLAQGKCLYSKKKKKIGDNNKNGIPQNIFDIMEELNFQPGLSFLPCLLNIINCILFFSLFSRLF